MKKASIKLTLKGHLLRRRAVLSPKEVEDTLPGETRADALLPEGLKVKVTEPDKLFQSASDSRDITRYKGLVIFTLVDAKGKVLAKLKFATIRRQRDLVAQVISAEAFERGKGYGRLLYQYAFAWFEPYGAWISSDPELVSSDASKVWYDFHNDPRLSRQRRPDVHDIEVNEPKPARWDPVERKSVQWDPTNAKHLFQEYRLARKGSSDIVESSQTQALPYRFSLKAYFDRIAGILDDVKAKYPKEPNTVDFLSQNDPSGRNKYLAKMMEWYASLRPDAFSFIRATESMVLQGTTTPELDRVINLIQKYHKVLNKLPKELRDVRSLSLESAEKAVARYDYEASEAVYKKNKTYLDAALSRGAQIILQGPDADRPEWFLFHIPNQLVAYEFGKGLSWCISQENSRLWVDYNRFKDSFYGFIHLFGPSSRSIYQVPGTTRVQHDTTFEKGRPLFWDVNNNISQPMVNPDVPVDQLVSAVIAHSSENTVTGAGARPIRNNLAVAIFVGSALSEKNLLRRNVKMVHVADSPTEEAPSISAYSSDASDVEEEIINETDPGNFAAQGYSVYLMYMNEPEFNFFNSMRAYQRIPIIDHEDEDASPDSPDAMFPSESFVYRHAVKPEREITMYAAIPIKDSPQTWEPYMTAEDIESAYQLGLRRFEYESLIAIRDKSKIPVSMYKDDVIESMLGSNQHLFFIVGFNTIGSSSDASSLDEVYLESDTNSRFGSVDAWFDQFYVSPDYMEAVFAQGSDEALDPPPQDSTTGPRQIGP